MDDDVKINVSAHINNIGLPCYLRAHGRACDFTATPRRPYIQIKKGGGGEKKRELEEKENRTFNRSEGRYMYICKKVGCITWTRWMLIKVEWKGLLLLRDCIKIFNGCE